MSASIPAPTPKQGKTFDQLALERVEASRKNHEAYRDARVRAQADDARLTKEIEADFKILGSKYNATDVGSLRSWIVERRAQTKAMIDEYEEMVASVGEALKAVDDSL